MCGQSVFKSFLNCCCFLCLRNDTGYCLLYYCRRFPTDGVNSVKKATLDKFINALYRFYVTHFC